MTDDIVTRLRNRCDSTNCWCPMGDERCIYADAVDEIERLRAQLTEPCSTCGFYRDGVEPNG